MATNLRKYTTQEVLNKVYEDSSGNTIGINAATSKETLNAALDEANSRLNVSLAGGTISGDVTISGDLTVSGGGTTFAYNEVVTGDMSITLTSTATSNALFIDHNMSGTSATDGTAFYVDFDRTDPGSGTEAHDDIGINLDVNSSSKGASTVIGMDIDVVGAGTGTQTATGLTVDVSGGNTNYAALFNGGNVGIGIAIPTAPLEVYDTGGNHIKITSAAGAWRLVTNNSTGAFELTESGVAIQMTVLEGGNVGIGDTDPSEAKLSIDNVLAGDAGIKVVQSQNFSGIEIDQNGNSQALNISNTGNEQHAIYIHTDMDGDQAYPLIEVHADHVAFDQPIMKLRQDGTGDILQLYNGTIAKFVVDDAGNVGIGGAPPTTANHHTLTLVGSDTYQRIQLNNSGTGGRSYSIHSINENDAAKEGKLAIYDDTGPGWLMALDANSRISLSNNDGGAGGAGANTIFGKLAGAGVADGALYNVLIGEEAGNDLTVADHNVAIGYQAFDKVTTACDGNVAIGYQSMHGASGSDNADNCVFIGKNTCNAAIEVDASGSVGIGFEALKSIVSGVGNTAIGYQAADTVGTGSNNTIVGFESLRAANTAAANNTTLGQGTMKNASSATTTGNIAIGTSAMTGGSGNMTGNIAIGLESLDDTAGNAQTGTIAIGHQSLTALTTGSGNTAVGYLSGKSLTTADNNTFVGQNTGEWLAHDSANGNVAVGFNAMGGGDETTTAGNTASYNVAIGGNSVGGTSVNNATDLEGNNNVGIGWGSLATVFSASDNIAIGKDSGNALTTGGDHVLIGSFTGASIAAGQVLTNGTVAIGKSALAALTLGERNVAIGFQALEDITEADDNVALGYLALNGSTNTGSNQNVAIGSYALDNMGSNASTKNTAVGHNSLTAVTTGDENTALGRGSGVAISSGSVNTCIGNDTGTTITTGSHNTLIGIGANVDANSDSYHVRLGHAGGIKYFTAYYTLNSSYTGTPADGDAAHSNALFVIPAKSYISKVYATVDILSANSDADFMIVYDDTLDVASGAAISGYTEILGAGAESNAGIKVRSHDAQTAASDIGAGSGDVLKNTWVSDIDVTVDNSVGWVDTDVGIYVAHTKANTTSAGATHAVIQLTVEYTGLS